MVKLAKVVVNGDIGIIEGEKEANRIYNKGCYGEFDGKLKLSLIEICYLLEKERVDVEIDGKAADIKKFMEYALHYMPDFEIRYLVYRDLRERGYILKVKKDFLLYERGRRPPAPPGFVVKAVSERARFRIKDIDEFIEEAKGKLILGIVDEEGDITYYIAKHFVMNGVFIERDYEGKIHLLNDRCVVWDENLMEMLKEDFIGKSFGKYMQLSLMEAAYVAGRGASVIKNGRKMSIKRFLQHAKKIQPDIEERLAVYENLRKKGLLPKTGFKFGSHFRVYDKNPEESHAPYLVHVVRENYEATWAEISRAVRLAHSVRKEMVFGMINGGEIKYIRLKRITP